MKPEGKGLWKGLSSIAFIISAIVLGFGLDKMFNYDSGEYYPYEYHNAYVGGDAYNYIINGNYATGFFVLAAMFALMGIGFIILYYLSKMADGQDKLLISNHAIENGIYRKEDPQNGTVPIATKINNSSAKDNVAEPDIEEKETTHFTDEPVKTRE